MSNEVREKLEDVKPKVSKPKVINHKFTPKAYRNLLKLQVKFRSQTGGSITQESLINRILESATLPL